MAEKLSDFRDEPTRPVFRVKMGSFTWAAAVGTAVVKPLPVCGRIRVVIGTANDSTVAVTYTTTIADEDGTVLYTKADWAEAATELVQLTSDTEIYAPPGCTMTITPSAAPGASTGIFDVTLIGA